MVTRGVSIHDYIVLVSNYTQNTGSTESQETMTSIRVASPVNDAISEGTHARRAANEHPPESRSIPHRSSQNSTTCTLEGIDVSYRDSIRSHPSPPRQYSVIRQIEVAVGAWSLRRYFKTFNGREHSKQVCSNSKLSALRHFAFFHLPAISITLSLLGFYLGHLRWVPPHPTADELSALQFAAKAHESLILMSLTDILLHRICYGLILDDGVSLGFLSSVFNMGSPVQYLMSWEFWAALLNPTANRKFHGITGGVIVFISLLGIAASPFSATAMIPRQGWWLDAGSERLSIEHRGTYYIRGNPFRRNFNAKDVFRGLKNWCSLQSSRNVSCWDLNLEAMVRSLESVVLDPPIIPRQENVTYTLYGAPKKERPISVSKTGGNIDIAIATCPMICISDAFNWDHARIRETLDDDLLVKSQQKTASGIHNWKQPVVGVHCSRTPYDDRGANFSFVNGLFDKLDVELDSESLKNYLLTDDEDQHDYFGPLKPQHINSSLISGAILFSDELGYNNISIELCLISARWAEAEVWLDRQSSGATQSSFGISTEDLVQYLHKTSNADHLIKTSTGWLEGIGVPRVNANNMELQSAYSEASQFCLTKFPQLDNSCRSIFLALHVADALAQSADVQLYVNNWNDPPGQQDTVIHHTYYASAYAYAFQNSTAITLAFVALLLHVFISLLHMGSIIFSRQSWHGSSWDSFGKLLVLALQSRASDELENVGGGVSSSHTWKKRIVVREVGDKRQIQLIVGDAKQGQRQGLAGILEDGAGDSQIRLVKTATKYS